MPKLLLTEVATGAVAEITNAWAGWPEKPNPRWEDIEYIWTEGNFSCDCNRASFFAEARGEPQPKDRPCSQGRYVLKVLDDAGGIIVDEAAGISNY